MTRLSIAACGLLVSAAAFGADVFGPKPFNEILDSSFP